MISRDEAISVIRSHVKNQNLVKHMISVGAIMRGLAKRFGEDSLLWENVGILHDADYEKVGQNWTLHGAVSADIVKGLLPEDGLYAIRSHNPQTGYIPKSRIDISLYAADALSGLVIAQALMMPDKKITSIKASSLAKRMKDKSFARGVNRDNILRSPEIGLELIDFLQLGIDSMSEVSQELGL